MSTPADKIAATVALTRVERHYELYSSRATLGLICRPVKRIPKKDNNDVKKLVNTAIDTQKNATPNPPPANGEQGAGTKPESAATVAVDNATQKAAEDAIGKVLGGFRAKLLVQDEIENKNKTSEDEYGPLIKMPLPEKIKDSLRVNYSTVELGFAAAGYLFGENVAKPFKEGAGIADTLVGNASYVIRTLLSSIPSIGALAQKSAGNIPNPFTAAIFEKVTPRKFNFSWTIQPQTAEESKNLRDIINQFRYWSLPNPSSDALILDVPYEWELSFVGTDFLYAFSRCVMTNLDIDYSPNGFNAFMIDGAPQSVTITIDFEEIYPLDKENMDKAGTPESMKIEPGKGTQRAQNNALQYLEREEAAIKQRAQIAASATKESELAGELSKALEEVDVQSNPNGEYIIDGYKVIVTDASRQATQRAYDSALSNLENQQNQTQIERTKLAEITGEAVQAPGG
jgi:hypothetical protein